LVDAAPIQQLADSTADHHSDTVSANLGREMDQKPAPLPALVVVPRRPGPLILPPAAASGARDEIDIGLDELFGDPGPQKPGPLDAALVLGGLTLIVVAEVAYHGGALLWVGGLCVLLGMALPLRGLWRMATRARSARRLAATLKRGDPLNLNDATTRRLAAAYTRIVQAAPEGDPAQADAAEAALQALQEVASLLKGRPPRGAAEAEYVARRAEAVERLARWLLHGAGGEKSARDAAVEAISKFEERTGMSALDRIESIRGGGAPADTRG
jgi:hypothetical protein